MTCYQLCFPPAFRKQKERVQDVHTPHARSHNARSDRMQRSLTPKAWLTQIFGGFSSFQPIKCTRLLKLLKFFHPERSHWKNGQMSKQLGQTSLGAKQRSVAARGPVSSFCKSQVSRERLMLFMVLPLVIWSRTKMEPANGLIAHNSDTYGKQTLFLGHILLGQQFQSQSIFNLGELSFALRK